MKATSIVQCGSCGHAHTGAAWSALPTVHTLAGAELGPYVVGWPQHATIEVRACVRCDRRIARLSSPLTPSGRVE